VRERDLLSQVRQVHRSTSFEIFRAKYNYLFEKFTKQAEGNKQNLKKLHDHLETGSGVVCINHTSFFDPLLTAGVLINEMPDNMKVLGGAQSRKHADFMRRPHTAAFFGLVKTAGLRFSDVVQVGDDYYSDEVRARGTRSDGKLLRAQAGLEIFRRNSNGVPTVYVPIALVPPENTFGKFELKVGEPFDASVLIDGGIPEMLVRRFEGSARPANGADLLMIKLAALLPPHSPPHIPSRALQPGYLKQLFLFQK